MKNSHSCLTVIVVDIPGQFFAILKLFAALLYKSDASSSFAVALQEKVDQWQLIVTELSTMGPMLPGHSFLVTAIHSQIAERLSRE